MGAVYRATDTKLNRDVAIKVLPDAFATDPDRLARFTREAQVLASLNHPNIAHIYGVEDRALVMELVEGEELKGPMHDPEALQLIRQLIEALEYAHEKGIIHRDLKPANIKVTPEGKLKVLDFGLAKAITGDSATAGDPASSPTLTMSATMAGALMGTAAYMAPEQARGKTADKRADIWAFGAIVYELLAGRRLFDGETISDTLAAVLTRDPDLTDVPSRFHRLLRLCLQRDPRERLRDIGDARPLLDESGIAAVPSAPTRRVWLPWAIASVALAVASASVWFALRGNQPRELKPLVRLDVDLGPNAERRAFITAVLSPDGRYLAFPGRAPSGSQFFIRRLDQPNAAPIPGSEGRQSPESAAFFSPDSQWVAFYTDNKIKKAAVEGGTTISLADWPSFSGGTWADDGNLYLGSYSGIYRLSANGGAPQPVKPGMGLAMYPYALPGSRALLFDRVAKAIPDVSSLELKTGQIKSLVADGVWPAYSARAQALLYRQSRSLFAVSFHPERLEVRGSPVPVISDIYNSLGQVFGGGPYSFSNDGSLAYSSSPSEDPFPIVWLDPSGKETPLLAQPATYSVPRLSPDGSRLAFATRNNVWIYNLNGGGAPTQLTFNSPGQFEIAWAPDSRHILYGDASSLWWIRADGAGQPQQLAANLTLPRPTSVTAGGRVALSVSAPGSIPDLYTMGLDLTDPEHPKAAKPEPFLNIPNVVEVDGAFSPDGKFLAYASNESGPLEIFVRAFPGPSGKWKIGSGMHPVWSRAARQLFYFGNDDRIMAVDYSIEGDTLVAGPPRQWSPTPIRRTSVLLNFDISPDGKRAVVFPASEAPVTTGPVHVTFLLNFFDELKRRLP